MVSITELLDGTLKLQYCTEFFTMRFPPLSLPRVGSGSGKRQSITPGHLLDAGGNLGTSVLPFFVPCVGLLFLSIWVILEFPS